VNGPHSRIMFISRPAPVAGASIFRSREINNRF
jgi:hypothetical protein